MIRINAMGEACPLPVVKTLRALQSLGGAGSVETLVDNETAVQNLRRLAESKGCSIEVETISDAEYRVTITVAEGAELPKEETIACTAPAAQKKTVVVISADHMGEGNEELGRALLKAFLFALTQQETLPAAILFLQRRRGRHLRRLGLARGSAGAAEPGRRDSDLRHLPQLLRPDRKAPRRRGDQHVRHRRKTAPGRLHHPPVNP